MLKRFVFSSMIAMWVLLACAVPFTAFASYSGAVAGWIPYWQDTMGVEDAQNHLRKLDTIYPFVYSVRNDGTLVDLADLTESKWRTLLHDAQRRKVEVIPTVMWSDGDTIDTVLSDRALRTTHVQHIVSMVNLGDYDGVNIDYESKKAETIDYYSTFLKELKANLGDKLLTCTIEPRTPPDSFYSVIPDNIQYANDYTAMNTYCDEVEIMAYDQQRADIKLDAQRSGEPYMPIADEAWVEKVLLLALKDIDADKIMLGVPTYGRSWTITVKPNWYSAYAPHGSINLPDALDIAHEYNVTPGRNKAGEMSFTYFPKDSIFKVLNSLDTPEGTRPGFEAAAKALLFANYTGMTVPVNLMWYSSSSAIKDKIELAQKYNLKGVAIFKIDGEEDPNIWTLF